MDDVSPEKKRETTRKLLPDAEEAPNLPQNMRWPLEGKMDPPTVPPMTAEQRRAEMNERQRSKRRRGFLIGLLVGQALIAGIIFGSDALLKLRPDLQTELPLRLLVFLGITGGLAFTGLMIGLLLFFQGLGYVFRPRGKKFGVALWNGVRRVGRAAFALAITLLVLGGTAAATISPADWKPHGEMVVERGKQGWKRIQEQMKK